eukprot:6199411-Pleurochrysis_carterae.AAC.1
MDGQEVKRELVMRREICFETRCEGRPAHSFCAGRRSSRLNTANSASTVDFTPYRRRGPGRARGGTTLLVEINSHPTHTRMYATAWLTATALNAIVSYDCMPWFWFVCACKQRGVQANECFSKRAWRARGKRTLRCRALLPGPSSMQFE